MVEVRPKWTRVNPSSLHPRKAHKRLVRDTRHREWLRFKIEGKGKKPLWRFMTKLRGKPSTEFKFQKKVTPMPKTKSLRCGKLRGRNVSKARHTRSRSKAQSAAAKAWATIRAKRAKK